MTRSPQPLRVGVGGPVGSGKTTLVEMLCKAMRDRYDLAVVTNDIYTKEDERLLVVAEALAPERIMGVETGGCPHTAIREDASINLDARRADVGALSGRWTSSSSKAAATISPRRSRRSSPTSRSTSSTWPAARRSRARAVPGITRADLLIINKVDLAPYVGASLDVMAADTRRMRGARPFVFTNLKTRQGVDEVVAFIEREGLLGG